MQRLEQGKAGAGSGRARQWSSGQVSGAIQNPKSKAGDLTRLAQADIDRRWAAGNFLTTTMAERVSVWNREKLGAAIRARAARGEPLTPRAVERLDRALFWAGRHHFGSWRKAVEAAGVDYPVPARPHVNWTRAEVVRQIKARHKAGERLSMRLVEDNDPSLSYQARKRFGTWQAAITAAGLDYAQIRMLRRWTDAEIVEALRASHRAGLPVNSGAVRRANPSLATVCYYHFGTWRKALKTAGIPYVKPVRAVSKWNRDTIVAEVRRLAADIAAGRSPDECRRRRRQLVGVASRHGGWARAVKAAGLTLLSLRDSHTDRIARLWAREHEPWTETETARFKFLVRNKTSTLAIAIHLARSETALAAKARGLHIRLTPPNA